VKCFFFTRTANKTELSLLAKTSEAYKLDAEIVCVQQKDYKQYLNKQGYGFVFGSPLYKEISTRPRQLTLIEMPLVSELINVEINRKTRELGSSKMTEVKKLIELANTQTISVIDTIVNDIPIQIVTKESLANSSYFLTFKDIEIIKDVMKVLSIEEVKIQKGEETK
jgi:hypothetical protein